MNVTLVLLGTHASLWCISDAYRLAETAREIIADSVHDILACLIVSLREIVEGFVNAATSDAKVREDFFHRVLARIVQMYGRPIRLQRIAINLLSNELSWSFPDVSAIE